MRPEGVEAGSSEMARWLNKTGEEEEEEEEEKEEEEEEGIRLSLESSD